MTSASRGPKGGRAHRALQLVARIEQARRVEHDHLHVVGRADADDAVARRLRLLAHDASFSPTMRLRSVDLPALGLPTTVTIPARDMVAWSSRRGGKQERARMRKHTGPFNEVPATAYSPASSRTEYHRRCRA